jgi:hypothetical protein
VSTVRGQDQSDPPRPRARWPKSISCGDKRRRCADCQMSAKDECERTVPAVCCARSTRWRLGCKHHVGKMGRGQR